MFRKVRFILESVMAKMLGRARKRPADSRDDGLLTDPKRARRSQRRREKLPPEIMTQIEESRRHPERDQPRPRRREADLTGLTCLSANRPHVWSAKLQSRQTRQVAAGLTGLTAFLVTRPHAGRLAPYPVRPVRSGARRWKPPSSR